MAMRSWVILRSRRLGLEVGKDLLEGVGVDAAAGHVLGAGEVAALDDQTDLPADAAT